MQATYNGIKIELIQFFANTGEAKIKTADGSEQFPGTGAIVPAEDVKVERVTFSEIEADKLPSLYEQWQSAEREYARDRSRDNRSKAAKAWIAMRTEADGKTPSPYHF